MALLLKNTPTNYGLVAIALHWLTALAVLFLFGLGLYMTGLDYYDPLYHKAPWVHKSIGLLCFTLVSFRLFWRIFSNSPKPLGNSKTQKAIAGVAHIVLYVLMFVGFLSGYLISSADGTAVSIFNWVEIPGVSLDIENQEDKAGIVHLYVAWGLIVLASIHALAAMKHHFINRDATLRRMLLPSNPAN